MTPEGADPLTDALRVRKGAIVRAWLARMLRAYPDHTSRFLDREQDPFRNPVGHTLKEALAALFDELLGEMNAEKVTPLLDGIVRIRAVQDFTASQAVAFPFHLKMVLRETVGDQFRRDPEGNGLAALDDRIDQMALLAFDLFMRCRESIYEVRANETRRRLYLLERMHVKNLRRTDEGHGAPSRP